MIYEAEYLKTQMFLFRGETLCPIVLVFNGWELKVSGGTGFADVWYRDRFVWEYKTAGRSLESAYQQLQLYKEDLDNPPVLSEHLPSNAII